MTKAQTMEDIRICYSLLSFVNEGEGSTRLYYLNNSGLKDADRWNLPQRPENKVYTDHMLEATKNGGMAECLMACLPCMISYYWIFRKLLERSPDVKNTPYWPLVRDYASEDYLLSCRKWAAYTDQLCAELSSEQKAKCIRIFRDCSLHELHFWCEYSYKTSRKMRSYQRFSASNIRDFDPHPCRMRLKFKGLSHALQNSPPDCFVPSLCSGRAFESHLYTKIPVTPYGVTGILAYTTLLDTMQRYFPERCIRFINHNCCLTDKAFH